MNTLIKVVLAILLFLCLLDFPYGYYQFVRFTSFAGFGYLAYQSNSDGRKEAAILFILLALLFQPFLKISLGRFLWNVVDVIVGVGLLLSVFNFSSKQNNLKQK